MLLAFTFENDRAFARPATFNLLASKLKEKPDGRAVDIGDPSHTMALTSAVVLGKNGSGKSTLVDAMEFVAEFVRDSSREGQAGDPLPYKPNLLVDGLADQPTSYNVVFSMDGVVFDFSFSHDAERITYERLNVADRSARFRKMYERTFSVDQGYSYSFGEALVGRRSVWQESTRDNALFLSTAAQLNSDTLQAPYRWLSAYLRPIELAESGFKGVTARMCQKGGRRKGQIISFLRALDINISDIIVEEEEVDKKVILSLFSSEFVDRIAKTGNEEFDLSKRQKIFFVRETLSGREVRFHIGQESTGTQALFSLAGPLFDTLEHGFCLVVDEINTSLHPVILRFLVDIFSNTRLNSRRAQLVFTTHDTSILSNHRMRRDQVWFIENQDEGAALVPLTDYSPRKGEALDSGYLGGRYGGVPVVTPALIEALVTGDSDK